MNAGIDFVSLQYQAQPHLIVEECLNADNPIDEVEFAIFALSAAGHEHTAEKVTNICPQYGLTIGRVDTETTF